MTTTVVKTIGTGGDYSTLQAWEDACPADLTAVDQIWRGEVKNQEFVGASDATLLTISGMTTDATRYVELTTQAGASFADHASKATNPLRYNASVGAAIRSQGNYGLCIKSVGTVNLKISKLQIKGSGVNSTTYAPLQLQSSGAATEVRGCIIDHNYTGFTSETNVTFVNNAVIKRQAGGHLAQFLRSAAIHNCLFAVPSDITTAATGLDFRYLSGDVTVKNTAVFNTTEALNGSAPNTSTNNYTSDSTPPTGFTTATFASCVENTTDAALDLRTKAGAALIDAGADNALATTDIIGTSRTSGSYDVGAWEYGSGGGGSSGTITINDIYDFTINTPKASQTGVTVFINNPTTGELVVKLTGQTTTADADMTITDAALVSGTDYDVTLKFADGSRANWMFTTT